MIELPSLDFAAFVGAFDSQRRESLDWFGLAGELWDQSSELNAERVDDHPLCGGAVSRLGSRGECSCQYALYMLRWINRAPEDFLVGDVADVGDTRLTRPGRGSGCGGTCRTCTPH